MSRSRPCIDCRHHRRKCVYLNDALSCERCARLGRTCRQIEDYITPSPSPEMVLSNEEIDIERRALNDVTHQVDHLTRQVADMEQLMRTVRLEGHKANTYAVNHTQDNHHTDSKEWSTEWKLTIVNGHLRLETGIQSISQLLTLSKKITYLSPFPSDSATPRLLIFNSRPPSLLATCARLLIKSAPSSLTTGRMFLPSPPASCSTPEWPSSRPQDDVIRQLVDEYFTSHNPYTPLLHEPSFRKRLWLYHDPTTCPITMAMCASMAIFAYRYDDYSPAECRAIGEYFYALFDDILRDIYDDPERELDTVMSINLVQHFHNITLRLHQSRNLSTISNVICANLASRMDESWSPIDRVLFTRHHVVSNCSKAMMDFFAEKKIRAVTPKHVRFETLPDEPALNQRSITMFNHVLDIVLHPTTLIMINQVRRIILGLVGELTLEELVQHEQILLEWWNNLPDDFKLCRDMQDTDQAHKALEECWDSAKLTLFMFVQTLIVGLNSCFISPRDSQSNDDFISSLITERSFNAVLRASDLLIRCGKTLWNRKLTCSSSTDFLFRTAESLMSVIVVKSDHVARHRLKECLDEIDNLYPQNHLVPASQSPLDLINPEADSTLSLSITTLYDQYPLPGYALLYDVLRRSANRLGIF